MSSETFTTSICMDGEDFDDVVVELWSEPADPSVGYFHGSLEVETITSAEGVDITSRASEANLAELCDDFTSKMADQHEADECARGDYLYEQQKERRYR